VAGIFVMQLGFFGILELQDAGTVRIISARADQTPFVI